VNEHEEQSMIIREETKSKIAIKRNESLSIVNELVFESSNKIDSIQNENSPDISVLG
jgi:hypothetical protein